MCGICGLINYEESISRTHLKKMITAMHHRGPDDQGEFFNDNVALGFVRLSIIDLSPAGHQPFHSSDERYTMVFNGEIFNYIELKSELKKHGYEFKTETDTEVLMNAYREWGKEVLHKLNGMWAFAIYDKQKKTLFCARDRFGIKPFYYAIVEDKLIFASEIKSILDVLPEKPTANKSVLLDFLLFNKTEQSENTFFNGIKKLMHGHSLTIDLENKNIKDFKLEKWYDLTSNVNRNKGFTTPEEYKKLFKDSIGLRLRSDVPVGVCLSGGLDSSAITSLIIDDFQKHDLNTFSAVYDDSFSGDESKFINLYREKPGQRHNVTPSAESLLNDLDQFIECHHEPLPSTSPYAQYRVMNLAQGNVVVTLDGQGADEQLAGYHYFFGFYFKDLLRKGKTYRLLKEMWSYARIHKSLFAFKTFAFFLLPKKIRIKVKADNLSYINQDFLKKYSKDSIIASQLYGSKNLKEALINHFEYKLEHLLKWEDRNSMRFSIEARVPFLDYRLVEKTLASNSNLIIKDGWTKYILRESMKGSLPETIRLRIDKNGFTTPEDEWFRTSIWQEKIKSIINSSSFASRDLFDVKKVKSLYDKHINNEIHIAKEIWKWIHTELWFRKFID